MNSIKEILVDIESEINKSIKNEIYGSLTIEVNMKAGQIINVYFGVKESKKYE